MATPFPLNVDVHFEECSPIKGLISYLPGPTLVLSSLNYLVLILNETCLSLLGSKLDFILYDPGPGNILSYFVSLYPTILHFSLDNPKEIP